MADYCIQIIQCLHCVKCEFNDELLYSNGYFIIVNVQVVLKVVFQELQTITDKTYNYPYCDYCVTNDENHLTKDILLNNNRHTLLVLSSYFK